MGWWQRFRSASRPARRSLQLAWRRRVAPHLNDLRYGRMPVAMITGSAGKTTTTRLLAAILKQQGHRVGFTCTDGIYVDGVLVEKGDLAGYDGARRLLRKHRITAAVLETARGGLFSQGLFMKRGKVGALLNVASVHLGVDGIAGLDQMAAHKSMVVRGSRLVVLNADDPRCAAIAAEIDPRRLILFSSDPHASLVGRTIAAGGRAVSSDEEGFMVLLDGRRGGPERLARIADIPVTLGGAAAHYIANAMAAAALAIGLGASWAAIHDGLTGFRGGAAGNPGRWQEFAGYPFTLIAERGMNGPALAATSRAVAARPIAGRRLLLTSAVGSRSNTEYEELAASAAPGFDRFVLYDNVEYRRGREPGEVPALLRAALVAKGVPEDRIQCAASVQEGMAAISALAAPGDLLLLLLNQLPQLEPDLRKAFAAHYLDGNEAGAPPPVA